MQRAEPHRHQYTSGTLVMSLSPYCASIIAFAADQYPGLTVKQWQVLACVERPLSAAADVQ